MAQPIRVDIVSDVVCPWCIVGYQQLKLAAEANDQPLEIHWHPFELNPEMPAEGQDLAEHITEKYGSTPEESAENRKRLKSLGDELGFSFNYSSESRMRNTFLAHQLLFWADKQGREHDLKQALFKAYFTDQKDVNDIEVLVSEAQAIGLDADEARAVLTDGRHAEETRQIEAFWVNQGIRGVPAMVFQEKYLVTGARGIEAYEEVFRRLNSGEMS